MAKQSGAKTTPLEEDGVAWDAKFAEFFGRLAWRASSTVLFNADPRGRRTDVVANLHANGYFSVTSSID